MFRFSLMRRCTVSPSGLMAFTSTRHLAGAAIAGGFSRLLVRAGGCLAWIVIRRR